MNTEERRKMRIVVTGPRIDFSIFMRMCDILRVRGDVHSTFFDRPGENLHGAATFFYESVLNDEQITSQLGRVTEDANVEVHLA